MRTLLALTILLASPAASLAGDDGTLPLASEKRIAAEVMARLASDKPVEVALGAHLAAKHSVREAGPLLRKALDIEADSDSPEGWAIRQAALDALIRLGSPVPAEEVLPLREQHGAAAMILVLRDGRFASELLLAMAREERDDATWMAMLNHLVFSREMRGGVATYLLQAYPPKLVLKVWSSTDTRIGIGGSSGSAFGPRHVELDPPWPSMFAYRLTDEAAEGAVVLTAGSRAVFFQRVDIGWRVGPGAVPRNYARAHRSWFRDRMLTDLAISPFTLLDSALDLSRKVSIEWAGPEDYLTRAAEARDAIRAHYRKLLEGLRHRKLLLAPVPEAVAVEIRDLRSAEAKKVPLPELLDPR